MSKPDTPSVAVSYAFNDVLIEPGYSEKIGNAVDLSTQLTASIGLNIPILSSAMDTVTESRLAIAIAQQGGIGVIHKNFSPEQQVIEVSRVKRFESGMVIDPITISPNSRLKDALDAMRGYGISGIPITEPGTKKLLGIVTNRDVRFARDMDQPIVELMTAKDLVTVKRDCPQDVAIDLLHKHRIEKLLVVDDEDRCIGLITVTDIEKSRTFPQASKDNQGRLRVAAAVSTGEDELARAHRLMDAGVDVLVLDTAHGHSLKVLQQVARVRQAHPEIQIIGGNVATYDAAKALIDAGVDAVKIGIGPGSICTTRIVAGIGVPQLSAIWEASAACQEHQIPCIADGGIRYSGDIVKALAAGADCVMLGSLLAGTQEAPGEVIILQGRSYKNYRGMGSQAAMARGSADRYFQEDITQEQKLVPEGVEGRVPFKGMLKDMIHQLTGGLRAGMGYIGAENLAELQEKAVFRQISTAGLRESHVHDLTMTSEPPNYKTLM
ncbi:MAG: IMP dehydrogenase [Alphaproteobacteria bacterium]|nr:IMP dehydrogenase [Alphaproteobacteria bacterium]